jgi:hypothetical protein
MNASTTPPPPPPDDHPATTTVRPSLWKPGLLAGLVAAVATTTVVMVARAADVLADATTASRLVLGLTHLVAAAIVIPTLANRLPA